MNSESRKRIGRRALAVLALVVVGLSIAGVALGRVANSPNPDLLLIERTTDLDLPSRAQDVDITAVNYGHLYVVAHLRLSGADVRDFVAQLAPSDTAVDPSQLWSELLRPANRLTDAVVAEGQWRTLRGAKGDYDWSGMLDERTGRLWITLIPTCDPVTPTPVP